MAHLGVSVSVAITRNRFAIYTCNGGECEVGDEKANGIHKVFRTVARDCQPAGLGRRRE